MDAKQDIIDLVSIYYDDKEQLNKMLNESNVATDSKALRERAKELIQPSASKENVIEILNNFL